MAQTDIDFINSFKKDLDSNYALETNMREKHKAVLYAQESIFEAVNYAEQYNYFKSRLLYLYTQVVDIADEDIAFHPPGQPAKPGETNYINILNTFACNMQLKMAAENIPYKERYAFISATCGTGPIIKNL